MMAFARHLHDPCPHCPCGCNYWEDQFPGSALNGHWSVDQGSASIAGGRLTLAADTVLGCDVLSTDGTPYGVVLAGVNLPAGSPADAAIRLLCDYTDPDNYAFAEYRGDGTVHCGTRSGGSDSYNGTWVHADVPILGTALGGMPPLAGPLPFQLCYRPDRIMGAAQLSPVSYDANQVSAAMRATVAGSKCGIAANAAASLGAIIEDFRLNLGYDKNAQCAACPPACGQWQFAGTGDALFYSGLCRVAPGQFTLDLGSAGLAAGVTGGFDGSGNLQPQPCGGCTSLTGEYTLEFCPWDSGGADHDPIPWPNSQCYPSRPLPVPYALPTKIAGGECKWCYYGATALCDNETLFQAGLGIFPGWLPSGATGYQLAVDCWINSLPIPNPNGITVYPWELWHAWYLSTVFDPSVYPNCTDPIGSGLTIGLTGFQGVPNILYGSLWFGGQICGNPWPSVTIRC
jgi:hypothetical protein